MFSASLEGPAGLNSDEEPPGLRLRNRLAASVGGTLPPRPQAPVAPAVDAAAPATPGGLDPAFCDARLEREFAAHYAASMWRFDLAAILLHLL